MGELLGERRWDLDLRGHIEVTEHGLVIDLRCGGPWANRQIVSWLEVITSRHALLIAKIDRMMQQMYSAVFLLTT